MMLNVDRESEDLKELNFEMFELLKKEKNLKNLQHELYLTEENINKINDLIKNLKVTISKIEELIRNENINKILRENADLYKLEKHLALIKKYTESLEKSVENYNLYSIVSKYKRICGES
jgi:predicted  nucleic acid-binding Zn-ribbon protein